MASSVRTKGCKFCPKHPTKELLLVCKQCNNEPVCLTCLSTSHIGHNVVDLDIVAQEKYNYIQEINNKIEKENIPTIRTNLQIAEEKVRKVEQDILANIECIKEHHQNLRDLLLQDATAAVSKIKSTIEANKHMYEKFESQSEQKIESLKGRIIRNTETCKSKNDILTLDEAKELENIRFEIPTFRTISTEHFYPGINPEDYIAAAFGSVVHDDEKVPIAVPIESEKEMLTQKQRSSLVDLSKDLSDEELETNTSVHRELNTEINNQQEMQLGKKKTLTKSPDFTGDSTIAKENVTKHSSTLVHPDPIKFRGQLAHLGRMYTPFKTNPELTLKRPVLFSDGTVCDTELYRGSYLKCIDKNGLDFECPALSAVESDAHEKVQPFSSSLNHWNWNQLNIFNMMVNPLDDKLYLMMSAGFKIYKSIWSLDRNTEEMVKLFDVKEISTPSKFACLPSGDILIGHVASRTAATLLQVNVCSYSQNGECKKKKRYSILEALQFGRYVEKEFVYINKPFKHRNSHKRYAGELKTFEGYYTKMEWNKDSNIIHNICVCPTTGMVAMVVHASYIEHDTQKGTDEYLKEIDLRFSRTTYTTDLLVLDKNFRLMYRKHERHQSSYLPNKQYYVYFDKFGHLLLTEQEQNYVMIYKAATGQFMRKFHLELNDDNCFEFCWLNNDCHIVAQNTEDGALHIFKYIY